MRGNVKIHKHELGQWFLLVILATWEVEMVKIMV
jgi:hypothetical protein